MYSLFFLTMIFYRSLEVRKVMFQLSKSLRVMSMTVLAAVYSTRMLKSPKYWIYRVMPALE